MSPVRERAVASAPVPVALRRFRPGRPANPALTALVFSGSSGRPARPDEARDPGALDQTGRLLRNRAVRARQAGGELPLLDALSLVALLQARWVSSVELTDAYLARIARFNGDGGAITSGCGPDGPDRAHAVYAANGALNAYVSVYAGRARAAARAADARLDAAARGGSPAPLLCGLPIALKDVIAVDGLPLSLGCPALRGQRVEGDSVIAARLQRAGAVLLGHTHTGPWTADDLCPQTANPWRTDLAVGGSSGGSATAAAARLAALTVGTDTGNSVRNPAQQAGISAMKPSHGLIPLTGVAPLIPGLDHAGPMAPAFEDLSLLLSTLAGADPTDPRSHWAPASAHFALVARGGDRALAGLRIGSTIETEPEPARELWDPDVLDALRRAERELHDLGAEIVPIAPPARVHADTHELLVAHDRRRLLADSYTREDDPALATAVRLRHRRAPEERDGLLDHAPGDEQLRAARRARHAYRQAWDRRMAEFGLHAVLWPQKVQLPPQRADDLTPTFAGVDQARANTLGWPCAQLPLGRGTHSGLPVGVDIAAPWGHDALVLRVGLEYQARHPHHLAIPTP